MPKKNKAPEHVLTPEHQEKLAKARDSYWERQKATKKALQTAIDNRDARSLAWLVLEAASADVLAGNEPCIGKAGYVKLLEFITNDTNSAEPPQEDHYDIIELKSWLGKND